MRLFIFIAVLFLTFCISASSQDLPLMDSALAQVGMTSEDVRFDQDEMAGWGGDRWRLSYFTVLHKNPFKIPKYGQIALAACSTNVTNLTALVGDAGRRIDCPVRRGLIGDQLEQYLPQKDSLPKTALATNKGILLGDRNRRLRQGVDMLSVMISEDKFFLKRAFNGYAKEKNRKAVLDYLLTENDEHAALIEEMAEQVDFNLLVAAMEDLAELSKRMADSLEFAEFPNTRLEIPTRQGMFVIGTTQDDVYEYPVPPILIVDGGGNDTYNIKGYPEGFPVSIIVDPSGDDRYLSTDSTTPGISGAILGISILIDKAGNDRYESKHVAQGCGVFGGGLLLDYSGNDIYSGKNYLQGSGAFGIGILADSAGADSFYCVGNSQGYGYSKGCGMLINFSGDDRYVAEDSIITSPSPQTKEHNASLAQGVAFGRRADYVDGHSWAGGVGILSDIMGNDSYSAGLFAQGCAYWFSVGMLLDHSGDDTYNGVWYVQGSGAHFAVGLLDDADGNDKYAASMNMAVGAGHDFTIGYFNERAGNDTYTVPNLSLGGGNANGIGIFHDWAGDDSYHTKAGTTLGRANGEKLGVRKFLNTMGIFLDGGGNDSYDQPYAGNSKLWIGPASDTTWVNPHEIGVGLDR
jgi:hypothetical protein